MRKLITGISGICLVVLTLVSYIKFERYQKEQKDVDKELIAFHFSNSNGISLYKVVRCDNFFEENAVGAADYDLDGETDELVVINRRYFGLGRRSIRYLDFN